MSTNVHILLVGIRNVCAKIHKSLGHFFSHPSIRSPEPSCVDHECLYRIYGKRQSERLQELLCLLFQISQNNTECHIQDKYTGPMDVCLHSWQTLCICGLCACLLKINNSYYSISTVFSPARSNCTFLRVLTKGKNVCNSLQVSRSDRNIKYFSACCGVEAMWKLVCYFVKV